MARRSVRSTGPDCRLLAPGANTGSAKDVDANLAAGGEQAVSAVIFQLYL